MKSQHWYKSQINSTLLWPALNWPSMDETYSKLLIILCKFDADTSANQKSKWHSLKLKFSPQIPPGQRLETTVKINPTKEGIHTVMVDIDAAEVVDIKAMKNLTVTA